MSDFDYKYCDAPLRPQNEDILKQIERLADRLRAISENTDTDDCSVIEKETCRINVHHADQYCKDMSEDTIAVFCGKNNPPLCQSATEVHKKILKEREYQLRFSPGDRQVAKKMAIKRGTANERQKLACIERVGNEALCREMTTCEIHREYGFGTDCKVKQNLEKKEISDLVILEIILRLTYRQDFDPLSLSNNKKRSLLDNINFLTEDDRVRIYQSYFNRSTEFNLLHQLDTISRALLSKEDYITEKTMTQLIDTYVDKKDKKKIDVTLLTTLFNAASAALSMVVPWYVYFLAFPSGRQLLQNKVLNQSLSGYIFIVSLLLSKKKFKHFFDIYATIPPEYSEQFYSISATLSSLLLQKLSTNLEKT